MPVFKGKSKKGAFIETKDGTIDIKWSPSSREKGGVFSASIHFNNDDIPDDFLKGYLRKSDIIKDAKEILKNRSEYHRTKKESINSDIKPTDMDSILTSDNYDSIDFRERRVENLRDDILRTAKLLINNIERYPGIRGFDFIDTDEYAKKMIDEKVISPMVKISELAQYIENARTEKNKEEDSDKITAGTTNMKKYGVRYTAFNKDGELTTKDKWFSTLEKMEKYLDKLEDEGNLFEINGYSEDC